VTEPADDGNPIPLSAFLAVLAAIVAVVATVAFLGLRDDSDDAAPGTVRQSAAPVATDPAAQPTAPVTEAPTVPAGATTVGPCAFVPAGPASREVTPPTEADLPSGPVSATVVTSAGTLEFALDGAGAPCATASFVSLARQGFYDGTPCHRIIDGSVDGGTSIAQCGDPTGTGTGGPGYTYAEENLDGATYGRGVLAMAKAQAPGSTGSQFFIVTAPFDLPPEYTVLGTVTSGLEGLDAAIARGVKPGTESPAGGGEPLQPITITSVRVA